MTRSEQPRALAQAGPAGLALVSEQSYQLPAHVQLINREILELIAAAEARTASGPQILLVALPPRHGKSTLISVMAPAWYLGLFPERQVMLTSYEADFAAGWGMRARDHLAEWGPRLYGVGVDPANRAARRWGIQGKAGGMISAGVGGPITGRGAHLLIVDDPLKNAEAAMSEVIRERQWEWWLSTARSRLEPGAVVIVLMTRWHEADLGGRLLAASREGGDRVREIRLPAIAEAADPLGRAEGEALWPERYPRENLEHTRTVVGPYWFSAMYQGRPTPDKGGIFSRRDFRYFELRDGLIEFRRADGRIAQVDPSYCRKATYVDLAVSERQTADYTVALIVWVTPDGELLIRDVIRERIPGPEQPDFLAAHHVGAIKVEAIGYQSALLQALQRRGLPVEPVYPDKDKVTRASAAGALYRSGRVYHLRGAGWLHDFEAELLAFPAGQHDDQVDALAYAARDLPMMVAPVRRRRDPETDVRPISAGLMNQRL